MALRLLKGTALALGANYLVHVGSSLAYGEVCVPNSLWGVVQSLVSTASPVCSLLLTTMTTTQNTYAVLLTTSVAAALSGALKG